jgi:phosphatidylglycerol---prolipoprotein diacylglyceryl transferase
MNVAFIPSPSDGVWHLGPLPLRAYALAIILGIVVAIWVGERRFVARGGRAGLVSDVAVWAIPFGLVGARAYHVATNPEFYFGDGKDPIQALYVWEGGLGIWGAIAFGALGAYLGCRFSGVRYPSFLDAVAPGVVLAQAIGRWGNYFNQELFGKPTDQPWGLEISPDNRPEGYLNDATFHPTFLYESLWCIGVAIVIVLADRRYKLGRGRVFALYVALYTAGRAWIENLRIDDAHEFGGVRLNVWVALALFVLAVLYFIIVGRLRPGREESVYREGREPVTDADKAAEADKKDRVEAKVGAGAAASGATAAAGTTVGAGATPESETTADADTTAMPAAKAEPETKPGPEAKAEPETKPESEAKAEPETKPEPEAKAGAATTGEAGDRPDSEAKTETADATPDSEPEPKAEAGATASEATPAAVPDAKTEAAEAKPESESETRSEPAAEPEAKTGPESEAPADPAEAKAETAEATPESESEATPETAGVKPESAEAATDADAAAADADKADEPASDTKDTGDTGDTKDTGDTDKASGPPKP